LQQHRKFQALPFARKLEVMDESQEMVKSFQPVKPMKNPVRSAKS